MTFLVDRQMQIRTRCTFWGLHFFTVLIWVSLAEKMHKIVDWDVFSSSSSSLYLQTKQKYNRKNEQKTNKTNQLQTMVDKQW